MAMQNISQNIGKERQRLLQVTKTHIVYFAFTILWVCTKISLFYDPDYFDR